jgi:thiol:disulfide interchange protein
MLLLFLAPLRLFAQGAAESKTEDKGIHFFHGTWAELLAAAKKQNKPIFVDAYATWCGPCRYMAANVFTDPDVGAFFNENYICYKFDMEKGEGPDFANKYQVNAYPTLFFFDSGANLKNRVLGGQYKDGLITEAKKALPAKK